MWESLLGESLNDGVEGPGESSYLGVELCAHFRLPWNVRKHVTSWSETEYCVV